MTSFIYPERGRSGQLGVGYRILTGVVETTWKGSKERGKDVRKVRLTSIGIQEEGSPAR